MEDLLDKLGWQKTAAILIAASVAGLIFVVLSFANMDRKVPSKAPVANSTGSRNNIQTQEERTEQKINNASKTYTTSNYQVSYPESFIVTEYAPRESVLSSILLVDKNKDSSIEVDAFDGGQKNMQSFVAVFQGLGLEKSVLTVGNLSGYMFSGTIKGTKVYERVALLQKKSTVIKVQLIQQYGETSEVSQIFTDILNSLR